MVKSPEDIEYLTPEIKKGTMHEFESREVWKGLSYDWVRFLPLSLCQMVKSPKDIDYSTLEEIKKGTMHEFEHHEVCEGLSSD